MEDIRTPLILSGNSGMHVKAQFVSTEQESRELDFLVPNWQSLAKGMPLGCENGPALATVWDACRQMGSGQMQVIERK